MTTTAEATTAEAPTTAAERGPVVLLHSGVGGAGEWLGVAEAWPDDDYLFPVRAMRPAGTLDTRTDLTLDDYAQEVLDVTAGFGTPMHLVGLSWGGATALRVAVTAPERVATLTVIEPQAYPLLRDADPAAFRAAEQLRDRWREHVAAGEIEQAFRSFIDHFNGPGSFDAWRPERREAFLEYRQAMPDLWDVLFEAPTTTADLARITIPTLVVQGSASPALERRLCDVVADHLPHARRVVVHGAGHLVPVTHPAEVVAAVVAHLDATQPSTKKGNAR